MLAGIEQVKNYFQSESSPFYFSQKISERASLGLLGHDKHPYDHIGESKLCPSPRPPSWDLFQQEEQRFIVGR
jgi:hypothetical protein